MAGTTKRRLVRDGSAFPRLPRRFAPRNDTSGEREVHQCPPAVELLPTGRSLSAATDAIGRCVFIGTLYELEVPSRDCHVASLLAMTHQGSVRCTSALLRLNYFLPGAR